MYPVNLSEHFTFAEAVHSDKAVSLGIDNTKPAPEVVASACRTAVKLEKVREVLSKPIHVNSWIRCPALNAAVGSKDTSQHLRGEAVDFIAPDFGTPLAICQAIIANQVLIRFDQLILEHTWVHISFCAPDSIPRGQVLSLLATGHYAAGLTDAEGKSYD